MACLFRLKPILFFILIHDLKVVAIQAGSGLQPEPISLCVQWGHVLNCGKNPVWHLGFTCHFSANRRLDWKHKTFGSGYKPEPAQARCLCHHYVPEQQLGGIFSSLQIFTPACQMTGIVSQGFCLINHDMVWNPVRVVFS